jgi:hypothetical protein
MVRREGVALIIYVALEQASSRARAAGASAVLSLSCDLPFLAADHLCTLITAGTGAGGEPVSTKDQAVSLPYAPSNLASIRRHGLLSKERLIAMSNIPSTKREEILSQHRPNQLLLPNGVIIRDQTPMPPDLLAKALPKGISPSDWYRFLNRFVFLWADRERAERHRRAFSGRPQVLLVFDAVLLLAECKDQVWL